MRSRPGGPRSWPSPATPICPACRTASPTWSALSPTSSATTASCPGPASRSSTGTRRRLQPAADRGNAGGRPMARRARASRLLGMLGACCLALLATAWGTDRAAGSERGRFVDVGTREAPLRLWVEEQGRGKPVLLIHGLGATTYTWRELVPGLARTHRVIAVDLKGSGRSDKPLDDAYGVLDHAALLKTLIVRQHLDDLTLVGHSLGGGVALALALDLNRTHPGTLRRLVLISSIAYRQQLPSSLELLQVPVLAQVGVFAVPAEVQAYQGLYAAYYDPRKITREAVLAYAAPLYEPAARYALLKTVEQIVP